ncbi:Phage tail sheath protein FI [Thioalkalivibrio nitratireducens DSM 14787]|uniref:Phage tail sheath protein FI n=1 Tax=Thioalkalivibrio nitratireducens (strain DSM 14787 / UNIQEM 213 / ALEN2) TaxID=1255043 RepID=L0DXN4_THIND|nr:phage tail sheath subtilisin-like domain-containing protein [Thioalkalivibrio nitratireducens]AGA33803.1 Phage tail sheath protein FI [Thioalkalivibrio nitratireducens DSM 14787]
MSQYLAPGVFVEEVSFRAKSIEGVGTSVAAIVGPTRTGPLRGKPEVVTSFGEFERIYGDSGDLSLGGTSVLNHTAVAARAFFDNGGKQLFVARTLAGINNTDADGGGSTAQLSTAADPGSVVTFRSRFPGAAGNYTLELHWRDSENLLRFQSATAPLADGELAYLEATGLPGDVRVGDIDDRAPDARFPIDVSGLVRRVGDHYVLVGNHAVIETADGVALAAADLRPEDAPDSDEGVLVAEVVVDAGEANVHFTRVHARSPASGALADGSFATLTLPEGIDVSGITGGTDWGGLTVLHGTLNANGTVFTVSPGVNPDVADVIELPLAALAGTPSAPSASVVLRNFDVDVRLGDADGRIVYSYGDVSTAPGGERSLSQVLSAEPERRYDRLTSPVACSLADGATGETIRAALYAMFAADALQPPPLSVEGPRYLIQMSGGSDGDVPSARDYAGAVDEVNGSTGLAALEDIEDISIVMTPAAAAHPDSHQAVVVEMQKHCRRMRYRIGIVDARQGMALSEIRDFASNFDDSRLALYYPWVVISDPRGLEEHITVPPAGFLAGIYANTDVTRGVHKAPANEPVIGALRFAQEVNRFQQELLNPAGINCLRSFPGRGHRVWGGRTLSSDPEWIYVNVRRYFLYLERSIDRSTQWVVFEPNGERLWANVRSSVEDFLYNEWFNGRLLGSSPKAAYFVRCDRSTMTQNDLDNGRLVCEVGVAALKPAEFVIFRIGQKTADA